MSDSTPAPVDPVQHVFQLATGYIVSTTLAARRATGRRRSSGDGPRTAAELAAATGANEDALYRVLRVLASVGVFDEVAPRTFALTPAADMLRKDSPGSMHGLVLFCRRSVAPARLCRRDAFGPDRQAGRPKARSACRYSSTSLHDPELLGRSSTTR